MTPFQVQISFGFILVFSLSLPKPTTAQNRFESPSKTEQHNENKEINEIDGKNIVNTPNRNSSTPYYNIPHMQISTNKLVSLEQACEQDSECGNYSVCLLKFIENDITVKACQCDDKEMIKANGSCYIKPGHQCYFPNKNSHGYSFIHCYPGSICMEAVNKDQPKNGYCMCTHESLNAHYRELNVDFEMSHCSAPSIFVFMNSFGSLTSLGAVAAIQLILKQLFL